MLLSSHQRARQTAHNQRPAYGKCAAEAIRLQPAQPYPKRVKIGRVSHIQASGQKADVAPRVSDVCLGEKQISITSDCDWPPRHGHWAGDASHRYLRSPKFVDALARRDAPRRVPTSVPRGRVVQAAAAIFCTANSHHRMFNISGVRLPSSVICGIAALETRRIPWPLIARSRLRNEPSQAAFMRC